MLSAKQNKFFKNHRNVLTAFQGKAFERFIEINYLCLHIYLPPFFQLHVNILKTFSYVKYIYLYQ